METIPERGQIKLCRTAQYTEFHRKMDAGIACTGTAEDTRNSPPSAGGNDRLRQCVWLTLPVLEWYPKGKSRRCIKKQL